MCGCGKRQQGFLEISLCATSLPSIQLLSLLLSGSPIGTQFAFQFRCEITADSFAF
jgi:hypothetical protein